MTDLSSRFSTVTGLGGFVAGRYSGRAAALVPTGSLIRSLDTAIAKGTLGFAFRFHPEAPSDTLITMFYAPNAAANFAVVFDTAGHVKVLASDNTEIARSAAGVIQPFTWMYCGVQGVCDTAIGSVVVNVDGLNVLSTNSFNTNPDNSNGISAFGWQLVSTAASSTAYLDDVYFCDGLGVPPYNSFLGVCRLSTVYPSGAGNLGNFTPSDHSKTNWQMVSEHAMDGDVSYNQSTAPDAGDLFHVTPGLQDTDVVVALETKIAARSDDASAVQTEMMINNTMIAGQSKVLGSGYESVSDVYAVNPTTQQPWASSTVNGLQFGYKITP